MGIQCENCGKGQSDFKTNNFKPFKLIRVDDKHVFYCPDCVNGQLIYYEVR